MVGHWANEGTIAVNGDLHIFIDIPDNAAGDLKMCSLGTVNQVISVLVNIFLTGTKPCKNLRC